MCAIQLLERCRVAVPATLRQLEVDRSHVFCRLRRVCSRGGLPGNRPSHSGTYCEEDGCGGRQVRRPCQRIDEKLRTRLGPTSIDSARSNSRFSCRLPP